MASEEVDYKGHIITIDAHQLGHGWRGNYQIDAGPIVDCEDLPRSSEKQALHEALSNAQRIVDRMAVAR